MTTNVTVIATLKAQRASLVAEAEKQKADPKIAARRAALQAELAALDNTEINQQIRAIDRAIHALENPTAPGPGKGQTLSPEHRAKIKAGLATYNERMKQLKADAKNAATRPVTATAIPAPLLKGKGKPATQPTA
jgi:hypothetical protein